MPDMEAILAEAQAKYIGKPMSAVKAALEDGSFPQGFKPSRTRYLGAEAMMTMDFIEDRLNIHTGDAAASDASPVSRLNWG